MSERETALKDAIDSFWIEVERSYDIEAREFFEREAVPMGFASPLAMAVHHMWKRDVKDRGGLTIRQRAAQPVDAPQPCVWRESEDGRWDTSCGRAWEFIAEGPTENGVNFCPYCGSPLSVVPAAQETTK